MIPAKIEALSAVGHGPYQHGLVRPEVVMRIILARLLVEVSGNLLQVENGGGEFSDFTGFLVGHVAGHGKRLQVDLGSHDGRPKVEQNPALQVLYDMCEDQ